MSTEGTKGDGMNDIWAVHEEWGRVLVVDYRQEGRSVIVETRHGERILLPTSELRLVERRS